MQRYGVFPNFSFVCSLISSASSATMRSCLVLDERASAYPQLCIRRIQSANRPIHKVYFFAKRAFLKRELLRMNLLFIGQFQ